MVNEQIKVICKNRKAKFEYFIEERFEAGMVLLGTEVKSLRAGKGNLTDAYVKIINGEAFIVGLHISPYTHATFDNHDPLRERKLLLHEREIAKLQAKVKEKGLTLIPISMYFKGSKIKLEIGVGKGKKLHDKRETLKERTDKRDMDRRIEG